jgi:hypothetical protein
LPSRDWEILAEDAPRKIEQNSGRTERDGEQDPAAPPTGLPDAQEKVGKRQHLWTSQLDQSVAILGADEKPLHTTSYISKIDGLNPGYASPEDRDDRQTGELPKHRPIPAELAEHDRGPDYPAWQTRVQNDALGFELGPPVWVVRKVTGCRGDRAHENELANTCALASVE